MGETTDQIESRIEHSRENLQSNLQELETKVKSATDWRTYYQKYPGMMAAAAFGGGMLLSAMTRKGARSAAATPMASSPANPRADAPAKHEILDTWDTIKTALVGVAATKFKGMLGEAVPGFSEHLANTEAKKTGSSGVGSPDSVV